MYRYETVECPRCGAGISVRDAWHPLTYAERAADDGETNSLFVIGGDRLLHTCLIDIES